MLTLDVFKLIFYNLATLIVMSSSYAQCNGQFEVCNKKYNEVAFLTTHNAFNTGSEGFSFPNHNYGIADQLDDGVRALMLDVYDFWGNTVVYHGSWTLGSQDIQDDFGEVKTFLDNNPNEIVTLILECYVDANTIESELDEAGLTGYLFTKVDSLDWPIVQDMINANKRLVVFTDENDASAGQEWYHYMWDDMVETHYSVNSPQDFTEDYNRGDSLNDLFIFNHFVTDATLGIGSESDAQTVNDYTFLMNRITTHFDHHHKFPNFITLDFYEHGNGLQVVQDLNAGILSTSEMENTKECKLYPNPTHQGFKVEIPSGEVLCELRIYDLHSKLIFKGENSSTFLERLNSGAYVVEIITTTNVYRHRVVFD